LRIAIASKSFRGSGDVFSGVLNEKMARQLFEGFDRHFRKRAFTL
jgi:hypothetical protein